MKDGWRDPMLSKVGYYVACVSVCIRDLEDIPGRSKLMMCKKRPLVA